MRFPGFIGPSYTLQSVNVDCQRTLNLYPEVNELGTGKDHEVAALRGTPGLRSLLTLSGSPVRALYTASNGQLFAVGGSRFYKISSEWEATDLGGLSTSSGPVSIADDGKWVVLVDGFAGYYMDLTATSLTTSSDPNFLVADQVTFLNGYFIFNRSGYQTFFFIGPDTTDMVFDALDVESAEGSPDNLVGLISDHQNLYLFGNQSTEVFYNTGDANTPFSRTQGAFIEVGCAAAFSVAKLQSFIYWLGQDESGRGIIYRAQGYQPQRISTHAIETVIAGLGDVSAARAWTYQQGGHAFYCLNLPGASTTWVYDASTQLWHERAYLASAQISRHRADCHAFAYQENVVGDYETGKIYALDSSTATDNGSSILRERTALHMSQDQHRLFHSSFQLDIESGVGTTGTGQGVNPKAILQWSDDGGHSWSNERWADIGKLGVRNTRVIWRRLGSSRDRVYRVRISDPVKVTLIGADVQTDEGVA